jgi:SSS family solute:Na+ symporter
VPIRSHGAGSARSIGAANLFTRNVWKAYVDPGVDQAREAQVAKITSLVVKFGALLVIMFLPTQFALDLQLLGGVWILQTLPALVFGLFFGWFRAPALLAGWLVGFAGGTALAWINGLKPLHALTLGQSSVTIYIGLLALAANILVAVIANLIWNEGGRPHARLQP